MSLTTLSLLEAALQELVEQAPSALNWGTDPARYPALITRLAHAIEHWLRAQRRVRDAGCAPVLLTPYTAGLLQQFRARDDLHAPRDNLAEYVLCQAVLRDYEAAQRG